MLALNDGRNELWQWDTGRTLAVDADCSQVHFSNKVFGRSIDMNVIGGIADIPDILLQTDKDLNVWAFVGTAENGYTKISKTFKVNKRNKPADYVFTPPEQTTLGEILERLDDIESAQDPDAIKNAVEDYIQNNPIKVDEEDPTVPNWAKQPEKPKYTAEEVGAVKSVNGVAPDENGNVEITIPDSGGNVDQSGGGLSSDASALLITILKSAGYKTDQTANIVALEELLKSSADSTVTVTSISAVFTQGNNVIYTTDSLSSLRDYLVVTAKYSDGTEKAVSGYTLSGTLREGTSTITVSYVGKTTTFTCTVTEPATDTENNDDITIASEVMTINAITNAVISDGVMTVA